MYTIPTFLTFFRIVLLPIFILVFYAPIEHNNLIASGLFALIAFTDWLDGYLARMLNQSSSFGAFLDPVADKICVVAALALLIEAYAAWWMTIPAVIIIGREIAISALREWMAGAGKGTKVSVSFLGKVKTSAQMGAIIILLAVYSGHQWVWVGLLLMYLATGLTLWSMVQYFWCSWRALTRH